MTDTHQAVLNALGCDDLDTLVPQSFLDRFGLDTPRQYGMVCADVKASAEELQGLGCSPFLRIKSDIKGWWERDGSPNNGGSRKTVTTDAAFGYSNGQQVELLGPGANSTLYTDKIPADGSIALHHVCVMQFGIEDIERHLNEAGYPTHISGDVGGGPFKTRFRYFDTREELGFWLEVCEYALFGRHAPPSEGFITFFAKLQNRGKK